MLTTPKTILWSSIRLLESELAQNIVYQFITFIQATLPFGPTPCRRRPADVWTLAAVGPISQWRDVRTNEHIVHFSSHSQYISKKAYSYCNIHQFFHSAY